MSAVLRFLVDATQTPNARVKTAALNYITKLAPMTDPSLAFPPPTPGQLKDTATAALTKMIGNFPWVIKFVWSAGLCLFKFSILGWRGQFY